MEDRWLDENGYPIVSPLHLAALTGMHSAVKILRAKGINPNLKESSFYGCSPLHMVNAQMDTGDVVKVLLDHELKQVGDQARTVMQWAAAFGVTAFPATLKQFKALE